MQAVQATRFGDPSVLTLVDLPDPTPGPGRIAIDVSHAAVGLIDLYIRQGLYGDRPGLPQPPYTPGLEVAGTVRALGDGVTGFTVGERVVALSGQGSGGYASVYVADQTRVVSTEKYGIDPALAVAAIPNALMVHIALTRVTPLAKGENVLVHGALGGFASAVPGIARQLGAGRVVGTVRAGKLRAAAASALPYDQIVDSGELPDALGEEKFDVIVDPVGGTVRGQSLDLLAPSGRLPAGPPRGGRTHGRGRTRGRRGRSPRHRRRDPPARRGRDRTPAARRTQRRRPHRPRRVSDPAAERGNPRSDGNLFGGPDDSTHGSAACNPIPPAGRAAFKIRRYRAAFRPTPAKVE